MLRALTTAFRFQAKTIHCRPASTASLKGIFPPVATPFNQDESIAWDKFEQNIKKLNDTPIRGFLAQGSNGEYCFLTHEERVEMIHRVKKAAGTGKLVMAGSGCESTKHTIEMSQEMASAGADVLLVITPNYFKAKMTSEAFFKHFTAVADASPVPVVLYNVPANTGVDMDWSVAARLAKHPNIIGMKESNGDVTKIGRLIYETRQDDFQVLAGSAGFLLGSLHVGAVGAVSALANVLPNEVCLLQELFEQGKTKEATELQQRLIAPNGAVTKQFGVPGLKKAMEWFDFYGGPTRAPLLPLTSQEEAQLRSCFSSTGFV